MSNLFETPSNLKAITINGAIVVESEEDKRKRAEKRAQRKSRWDNSKTSLHEPASKKCKNVNNAPTNSIGRNALTYASKSSPIVRDNPAALRERQGLLAATLDISKTDERSQQIHVLRLQIQDCSTRLQRTDLGIPENPRDRSPSPEPIYNNQGVRINTRIDRTKNKLINQRNNAITKLKEIDPDYQPPSAYKYKNANLEEKVMIPADEHPHINFVGLILGPRGKQLEEIKAETKCQIIVRGKGSLRSGMTGIKRDGTKVDALDDPLHAWIQGSTAEDVKKASKKIQDLIDMEIYNPDCEQMVALRAKHMHELAVLNGTLKEFEIKCLNCGRLGHPTWQCGDGKNFTSAVICNACGGVGHLTKDCQQRRPGEIWSKSKNTNNKEIDEEYDAFLEDMGVKDDKTGKDLTVPSIRGGISGSTGKFGFDPVKAPLMLTNGSSAPGAASAAARALSNPQTAGGGLASMGTSMFGGKLTRMTSGFKSAGEIEIEKEKRKKELENQPVPLEWQVQKYEKEYNKKQEQYLEHLERTVKQEKMLKAQKTAMRAVSSAKAPPPPPPPPMSKSFNSNSSMPLEFDLPNLDGNPWESLKGNKSNS